ncbi:MAG TPA: hypothetical protein VF970_14635 [Gemmatimonadales bacterium]
MSIDVLRQLTCACVVPIREPSPRRTVVETAVVTRWWTRGFQTAFASSTPFPTTGPGRASRRELAQVVELELNAT